MALHVRKHNWHFQTRETILDSWNGHCFHTIIPLCPLQTLIKLLAMRSIGVTFQLASGVIFGFGSVTASMAESIEIFAQLCHCQNNCGELSNCTLINITIAQHSKDKTKMVPLGWNQGSRDLVTIEYHIPVKLHEVNFQQNSWRFPTWRSYLSKVLCRLKVCFHEGYLQSFRTNMNVCNTKRVSAKQNASNMKRQSARQNASNTKRLSARQKRLSARQKRLSARQKRLQDRRGCLLDRRGCRTEEAVC